MAEVASLYARVLLKQEDPERVKSDVQHLKSNFQHVQYCFDSETVPAYAEGCDLIEKARSLKSISERGILVHPLFGEIILWRQHEFHSWWNLFENMVNHPLSRTLINGFVDSLEFNKTMSNITGVVSEKKFQKEMEHIMNEPVGNFPTRTTKNCSQCSSIVVCCFRSISSRKLWE